MQPWCEWQSLQDLRLVAQPFLVTSLHGLFTADQGGQVEIQLFVTFFSRTKIGIEPGDVRLRFLKRLRQQSHALVRAMLDDGRHQQLVRQSAAEVPARELLQLRGIAGCFLGRELDAALLQ